MVKRLTRKYAKLLCVGLNPATASILFFRIGYVFFMVLVNYFVRHSSL